MKTVYYADDGRAFDDYDDCEKYERQLKFANSAKIIFGFRDTEQIPYTDDDFIDRVTILYLVNGEAVDTVKNRYENDGYYCEGITDPGVYLLDDGNWCHLNEEWTLIDKVISIYEEKLEKLKNMKKMALKIKA